MDFKTSEVAFSEARLSKYLKACSNNKAKALRLYRYNIRLSQYFYGVVGLFEVILRNAVNRNYAAYFNDADWIIAQAESGKLLENDLELVRKTEALLRQRGIYSKVYTLATGDCMIVIRGELIGHLHPTEDFRVTVIYVTPEFIEISSSQSNYGMRGSLSLFNNPVMRLTPEQQKVCELDLTRYSEA